MQVAKPVRGPRLRAPAMADMKVAVPEFSEWRSGITGIILMMRNMIERVSEEFWVTRGTTRNATCRRVAKSELCVVTFWLITFTSIQKLGYSQTCHFL